MLSGTVDERTVHPSWSVVCLVVAFMLVPLTGAFGSGYMDALSARVQGTCSRFSPHDVNRDGLLEIRAIRPMGPQARAERPRCGAALVLVESRLLSPLDGAPDVRSAIEQHIADLGRAGWDAFAVEADLYAGPVHQDGRTIVALRRFLRALKARIPDLQGVTLVGSFPEAYLVRQYNWRQHRDLTINVGTERERVFKDPVHLIRTRAECVAGTADVVLADLDGRWDRIYHQAPAVLPWIIAVYATEEQPNGGITADYEMGTDRYEDFFFLNDGYYTLKELPDGRIDFRVLPTENLECSRKDLRRPNPMGRPDISVSRVNPRGIALRPKADVVGVHGEHLLGADGLPQTVEFESPGKVPGWTTVWEEDPVLERRLICEYFERNHRFRAGEFASSYMPASVSTEFGSHLPEFREAVPKWKEFDQPGYDLEGHDQATTLGAIEWLKRPAVLRAFKAHSDPWGGSFFETPDAHALVAAVGGRAWSWVADGSKLRPGLDRSKGKLDFPIFRSLYENKALGDTASLFISTGCESTMPPGAHSQPYSNPAYDTWQGAAGLMFYCNGLALVGRSKVFYDEPRGFAKLLGEGKTWGDAWRHYYEVESQAADEEEVGGGIGRKRAQFWGILGDWSLRLVDALGPRETRTGAGVRGASGLAH